MASDFIRRLFLFHKFVETLHDFTVTKIKNISNSPSGKSREALKKLETLNKLAESQAALSAGQAADKQKALAEKIIEGNKQLSDEALASEKSQHFLRKIFCRKKK